MANKIKKMINNGVSYTVGGVESSNDTYENIIHLTQAEYDALETKDPDTLYSTPDNVESGAFEPENEGTEGQVLTNQGGGNYGWGDINSGFKNISNCVYKGGLLVSFTADGVDYTLTYQAGRLKTVSDGTKTYTMTYKGGKLVGSVES